jgi:hypothetical protein
LLLFFTTNIRNIYQLNSSIKKLGYIPLFSIDSKILSLLLLENNPPRTKIESKPIKFAPLISVSRPSPTTNIFCLSERLIFFIFSIAFPKNW